MKIKVSIGGYDLGWWKFIMKLMEGSTTSLFYLLTLAENLTCIIKVDVWPRGIGYLEAITPTLCNVGHWDYFVRSL